MRSDVEDRSVLAASLRWLASGVVVLALHAGAILALLRVPEPASPATGAEPALMVDLEPVEGDARSDDLSPGEHSDGASPPAAAATDAAEPPISVPKTVAPPERAETDPVAQPPARSDPPKDEPAPEPEPLQAEQPTPPQSQSPSERPEAELAVPAPAPPRSRADAPPPSDASTASEASAAVASATSAAEKAAAGREAAWRGKLVAHLNRFRRFPPGTGNGTARVAFTIDKAGRVTTAAVVSSSGDVALDEAARALVERASPFPPPPPGVSGRDLSFVVPVRFDAPRP